MSRYSDLRWKIADLEKELAEYKAAYKRLSDDIRNNWLEMAAKDKKIEELKKKIEELKKQQQQTQQHQ